MSSQDSTSSAARRKPVFFDTWGRPIRHGMSFTSEYRTWIRIIRRCYSPKDVGYIWYGGRGICVCDRWRADFLNFFEDMGPRPGPEYSIDRIDPDGHYEPGNCRWATRQVQDNNRTNNRRLEYYGWSLTVAEWAWLLKVNRQLILGRLKDGWSIEEALTTPLTEQRKQCGLKSPRLSKARSGVNNGRAKLTPEQVREIRGERESTGCYYYILAERYGVTISTIMNIVKRKLWPDV